MNLEYLGDALDHWKGSIFESLQKGNVFSDFAVDPMITDISCWQPADYLLYAHLLRIKAEQIIRHNHPLQARHSYIGEIIHQGDLFLDPDTGVATSKAGEKYVLFQDIDGLFRRAPGRLLTIYQHIRAQRCADRVDNVTLALQSRIGRFFWRSYESPTVALLFLSRDRSRVAHVEQHFKSVLGSHANARIRGAHRDTAANAVSA
jgi:hypothetical protein